ncbi:MAG: sigma-70 family RNA polymerase sigma factor [Halobacteriovoraceae bacterium]|nr:sigma-70 family RNA polymerase sigma factor [Halobacteriovoraceae bacterium]
MIINDSELISRVLAYDDHYAYSQLVKKYQSPIRFFLRRLIGDKQEIADELAQETFMLAYRKLKTFQGKAQFSSWLFSIAKNQFLQYIRKNKRDFSWEEVPETGVSQETDSKLDLESAIKELRPIERAVMTLSYSQDLAHQDVANILEIPLGSVKTHLLRGKEKLKIALSGYEERTV